MSKTRKSVCYYDWNVQSVIRLVKSGIEMKKEFLTCVDSLHVFVAPVNRKGAPPSVSLIPGHDCPDCKFCLKSCYDLKHDVIHPDVMRKRAINSAILEADPDRFFREVSGHCKSLDRMRWCVGGDVKSMRMFEGIIQVAIENPHCAFHLFTKNNRVVNEWLMLVNNNPSTAYTDPYEQHYKNALPKNLHLRLSEWPNRQTDNPYGLNLCAVYNPDEFFEVHDGEAICSGNCTVCGIHSTGCFDKKIKRVWIAKH